MYTVHTGLDAVYFIPPIECARTACRDDEAPRSALLLQSRVTALTPILTACYTAQGITALLVVEGLLFLLNNTPFFAQDVAGAEDPECIVDDSTTTAVSTTQLF